MDAVAAEARRAWEEKRRRTPDERATTEKELEAINQKIARLVDAIENGDGDADDLTARLRQRRREKAELEGRLARLGRPAGGADTPPTPEWVAGRMLALGEVLRAGGPDAAHALRRLVGGAVTVAEADTPGRKRKQLVGTFTLSAAGVLAEGAGDQQGGGDVPATKTEVVTVAFGGDPPWAAVADAVKAAFDAGADYRAVAAAVGCPYPWVAKALAWWHYRRGLPAPDGRAVKARLNQPTASDGCPT